MPHIKIHDRWCAASSVRGYLASRPEKNGENLKVNVTHQHARTHTHTHAQRKHCTAGCSPCFMHHILFYVACSISMHHRINRCKSLEWHHVKQSAVPVCVLQPCQQSSMSCCYDHHATEDVNKHLRGERATSQAAEMRMLAFNVTAADMLTAE